MEVQELDNVFKPLLRFADLELPPAYYVLISHSELDWLIANLMHLAELDSDREHREALKGEIKSRTRAWLDDRYASAGYINHQVKPRAQLIDVNEVREVNHTTKDPENN